jgi:hypothetical protein
MRRRLESPLTNQAEKGLVSFLTAAVVLNRYVLAGWDVAGGPDRSQNKQSILWFTKSLGFVDRASIRSLRQGC